MHIVRFFPIGNADTCLIELANGRRVLFDFADMHSPDDADDKRCDLEKELREILGDDTEIDVVAFTHLDQDHCNRAKEVFYLEHAEKYQNDDRIRIKTLWVPAHAVLEAGVKGQARTLRAEARHRFLKGEGIRVFSRPEELDQFLIDREIEPAKRRNLISDAGTLCPEFNLGQDCVEFFVHSPFGKRDEEDIVRVRNNDALFMQAVFEVDGEQTKMILSADVGHEVIDDIVEVTRYRDRDYRLEWDINNIPHHCSYTALSDEKGNEETEPTATSKWLYEEAGQSAGLLVSTSKPIPSDDEDKQPPHRQAAAYYKGVARKLNGEWVVSMEHPTISKPEPLVIEIKSTGYKIRKQAPNVVVETPAPRAGI
ncbi:hypothetical protein E4656_12270 [Natronospirillum operosum]|uniref:MBL fold metallo-hydrolase n=1 Tax=Natronospirillum operosum TaxID=2759953 RepID=A0A4Z0WAY0_9GAMM|nr:hypothetical protein [Natronospirillum operosum]TGG92891.1 hypothetical protein E4656_12270 [Natronospirillum operosum]